ncbi:hypothetical protein [Flavobacterium inviolabile]|uniref:hypothetical protein n=1 Tax=Flavobacterium inviolabile TaxID=2748320 RepID=UPI0015AED995|nr:hypothetical protein [Flavobacterium inviolabile]
MKKILLILLSLVSFTVFSQAPQLISYQSIAYNSSNTPIINSPIGIKISILNLSATGTVLYSERHTRTTNAQGLYDLNIGGGTVLSGTFTTIPWGSGNKYLKVELDPTGGTNYTASGTSQFLSVPYALHSGSVSNGIMTIDKVGTLRSTIGTTEGDIVYVRGYASDNYGGGGHFIWRASGYTSSNDNGGTIIKPTITNPANGRWVRNIEGTTINVKWFGILGDGTSDYSSQLETLINTFKDTYGIKIVFPKGIYRLKNIKVPTGFTFSGEQGVSHDLSYMTPIIIRPALGAQYIFKFDNDTKNACLENLNIDGEANVATGQSLIAAVLFNGSANRLYNNNIVYCKQHCILSNSLIVSRIENNMLQGLYMPPAGPPPSLPYGTDNSVDNGHIGALHLSYGNQGSNTGIVDCWILNNEIGMSPYYGYLRNNNRKAVAFLGNRLHGSVISGNIFENGDKGAFLMDCTLNRFSNNRYEFNGSSGLEMIRCAESILNGEVFTGNSMAANGTYDDLVLDTSTSPAEQKCSGLTFMNPIFVPGNNGYNPTDRLPRYNINSYAPNSGDWKVTFVAPYFHALSRANGFTPYNKTTNETIPFLIDKSCVQSCP